MKWICDARAQLSGFDKDNTQHGPVSLVGEETPLWVGVAALSFDGQKKSHHRKSLLTAHRPVFSEHQLLVH